MLAIFCVVAKWPVKGSINSRITLHNSNVCRCMAKIQTVRLSVSKLSLPCGPAAISIHKTF